MNETADAVASLPALILLSFWWALLSTLDVFFGPDAPGDSEQSTARPPEDGPARGKTDPRLAEIYALDPLFDATAFLGAAQRAYEMVLQAYARGDPETLRRLLSEEVLEVFARDCAARSARGETRIITVVGLEPPEIAGTWTSADAMEIAVVFRAQIVGAAYSASGDIVSGDPTAVSSTADRWTFSRALPLRNDAWVIVATDSEPDRPA